MNLFYANQSDIDDQRIEISGQEANHISKVLRYNIGDTLYVTDGEGFRYRCVINSISRQKVSAQITETEFEDKPGVYVSIAIGLIKKSDRLEFAVEKCTELGIDEIILFNADHSEKTKVRKERILNRVLSAMKQSLRVYLPNIRYYNSTEEVLSGVEDDTTQIIIGDEEADENSKIHDKSWRNYLLIIGPEGGFSKRERDLFSTRKAVRYSLGAKRLRTETAAIVITNQFKKLHS